MGEVVRRGSSGFVFVWYGWVFGATLLVGLEGSGQARSGRRGLGRESGRQGLEG